MELSQDAIFFRSNDGSVFVYGDKWGQTLFYSPDGNVFFELFRHSIGGSPSEHDLWFEDARTHATARLRKKGEEIRLNGKTYKKTTGRAEIEVIPFPEVRVPKYLFRFFNEQYLYVSTDKYRDSHDSFRMFLGGGEAMKQISIAKVDWRHDNGTFNILTDKGNLFIPWKFDRELSPTWRKKIKLAKLDPAKFEILEFDNKVQLREKCG